MTLFRLRHYVQAQEQFVLHVNCEVGLDIFCEVDNKDYYAALSYRGPHKALHPSIGLSVCPVSTIYSKSEWL